MQKNLKTINDIPLGTDGWLSVNELVHALNSRSHGERIFSTSDKWAGHLQAAVRQAPRDGTTLDVLVGDKITVKGSWRYSSGSSHPEARVFVSPGILEHMQSHYGKVVDLESGWRTVPALKYEFPELVLAGNSGPLDAFRKNIGGGLQLAGVLDDRPTGVAIHVSPYFKIQAKWRRSKKEYGKLVPAILLDTPETRAAVEEYLIGQGARHRPLAKRINDREPIPEERLLDARQVLNYTNTRLIVPAERMLAALADRADKSIPINVPQVLNLRGLSLLGTFVRSSDDPNNFRVVAPIDHADPRGPLKSLLEKFSSEFVLEKDREANQIRRANKRAADLAALPPEERRLVDLNASGRLSPRNYENEITVLALSKSFHRRLTSAQRKVWNSWIPLWLGRLEDAPLEQNLPGGEKIIARLAQSKTSKPDLVLSFAQAAGEAGNVWERLHKSIETATRVYIENHTRAPFESDRVDQQGLGSFKSLASRQSDERSPLKRTEMLPEEAKQDEVALRPRLFSILKPDEKALG